MPRRSTRNQAESEPPPPSFVLDGVSYATYQEMVNAKRQRNQQILQESGLLSAVQDMQQQQQQKKSSPSKRKTPSQQLSLVRRKSKRLSGIDSDGRYIQDESGGRFTIATHDGSSVDPNKQDAVPQEPEHYGGRINDGSDISIAQAVEWTDLKNQDVETAVSNAQHLVRNILQPAVVTTKSTTTKSRSSPTSVTAVRRDDWMSHVQTQINSMSVDNPDFCQAKVVPSRIYGIACHPSPNQLIVAAGDKLGHVGLWLPDASDESKRVHMFRYHSSATACLEWTGTGSGLVSTSYDGTVRVLDVASEQVHQVFAVYNDSQEYAGRLGHGLDTGYRYWTQYTCLDHRFGGSCFFLSTSVGTVMHVDLRAKPKLSFHEQLSEKKINTVSLHPNGYSMITAGLDCTVKLWDLRRFPGKSKSKPITQYNGGKSVNSAFFSPSGQYVVSTTMNNKLDAWKDLHLSSSSTITKPCKSIAHDNHTGRWLTTFHAQFHPQLDIFCVGSMKQPRRIEVFHPTNKLLRGITGPAMTSVASRCCFHPSTDNLILVGGNSSGRVTVIR